VSLSLGAAVAPAVAADLPATRPNTRPNLIFILADDLGYGELGCYGQKKIKTPNLDRMAVEGLRFTQAYAGSTVCAPSRATLMTGQHTGHNTIRGNGRVDLRPDDVTVAEVLKRAGYATAVFGKWGLGAEGSAAVPTRKGFDTFFGYLDQGHAHNSYPTFLLRDEARVRLPNVVPNERPTGEGVARERRVFSQDLILDEAMAWLDKAARGAKPFFLYLTPTLPHANNEAKAIEVPTQGEYANEAWSDPHRNQAAAVSRLDGYVGRVLDRVRELGLDRRTVVFFSSDNGPHHEGGNDPAFFAASGPLRGGKRTLTEGGIRVPALAWGPGLVKARATSAHPWAFWDFLPTAAELAGASAATPPGVDGRSIAPVLAGRAARPHDLFYWEFHEKSGPARAVRSGRWKLIELGGRGGALELYDLERDPAERVNLAGKQAALAKRLLAELERARTEDPRWPLAVAGTASGPAAAVGK
jgi:arylsulfatase A-like enzyme